VDRQKQVTRTEAYDTYPTRNLVDIRNGTNSLRCSERHRTGGSHRINDKNDEMGRGGRGFAWATCLVDAKALNGSFSSHVSTCYSSYFLYSSSGSSDYCSVTFRPYL
jgi:hypothetical protein